MLSSLIAVMITSTGPAQAVEILWDSDCVTGTNSFQNSDCWVGDMVPGAADEARFDSDGETYTVVIGNVTNFAAFVDRGDITWDMDQGTYTLTAVDRNLRIGLGGGGPGNLTVVNGTVAAAEVIVGRGIDGNGSLTLTNGGDLIGTIGIIGGSPSSVGSITVSGADSQWTVSDVLTVGERGQGSLSIEAGGRVVSDGSSTTLIGDEMGASGQVTVAGSGSAWSTGFLAVGNEGNGTLVIEDGAAVTHVGTLETQLGAATGASGNATLRDAGSQWTTNLLRVGAGGTGSLRVEDGGVLTSTAGEVGRTSAGSATVTGTDAVWNTGSLQIGGASNGSLAIRNDGAVTVDGATDLRGNGTINIDGGEFTTGSLAGPGALNLDAGTLRVTSDFTLGNGGLDVSTLRLREGQALVVDGATTLAAATTLRLTDGAFTTGALSGDGTLNFETGTVRFTQGLTLDGTGPIAPMLTVAPGQIVIVDAATTIAADNTLTLAGGEWSTGTLGGPGTVAFTSGTLRITDDLTISGAEPLGSTPTLTPGLALTVDGVTTLDTGSVLTINGGEFATRSLAGPGALAFNTGTLRFNNNLSLGAAGPLGDVLSLDFNQTVAVGNNTTLEAGSVLTINGGEFATATITGPGSLAFNTGTLRFTQDLTLDGTGLLGDSVNIVTGQTIAADNGTTLAGGSTLTLNGGELSTLSLAGGGNLVFNTGTLSFTEDFTLDANGPLGTSLGLTSGQRLSVGNVTTLETGDVLALEGGTFSTRALAGAGTFVFNAGTLEFTDNFTLDGTAPLGDTLALTQNRSLTVGGASNVDAGSTLSLDGGTFSTGQLTGEGNVLFNAGSLVVTQDLLLDAASPLGNELTLDGSRSLVVGNATTLGAGSELTLNGGEFSTLALNGEGTLAFNGGTLRVEQDLGLGATELVNTPVVLGAGDTLYVGGLTTIGAGGSLDVDGGNFASNAVTATGVDARWRTTGSLEVGNFAALGSGTDTVTVESGATVEVSEALTLAAGGSLSLQGGTLRVGSLEVASGTFAFDAGTVSFADSFTLGATGPLGDSLTLTAGQTLAVDNLTTLETGSSLTLDGGEFSTGTVTGLDALTFTAGTLRFNQDISLGTGSPLGESLNITAGQIVAVNNQTTLDAGSLLTVDGGELSTGLLEGAGVLAFDSGTLRFTQPLSLDGDGPLGSTLNVSVDQTVAADAAATITAGSSVVLDGGELATAGLAGDGSFTFNSGVLRFTQDLAVDGTGPLGGTVNVQAGQRFVVAGSATVEGGSTFTVDGGEFSAGTLIARGSGSQWRTTGSFGIGGFGSQDAEADAVVVETGATVEVAQTLTIEGDGSLTLDGGTLRLGDLDLASNNFAFNQGVLNFTDNFTISTSGPLGSTVSIVSGQLIAVDNTTTVNSGSMLSLDGGELSTLALTGQGELAFSAGTLRFTDDFSLSGSGPLGDVLRVVQGQLVAVQDRTTLGAGTTLRIDGGEFATATLDGAGVLEFNTGTLRFTQNFTLGGNDPTGNSLAIANGQQLTVEGATSIDTGSVLTLDGGVFSTATLASAGTLAINTGTLQLREQALVLSAGEVFGDTLRVGNGQSIDITLTTQLASDGVLLLEGGDISAARYLNAGQVILTSSGGRLRGGPLENTGIVEGDGIIEATLINEANGEVRGNPGDRLQFAGSSNTNRGEIANVGGEIEFSDTLTNETTGLISGRGTFRTGNGFTNDGRVALSGGLSDLFGNVDNRDGGSILISGNATVTFWDDVIHNGTEIRVSGGSTAVFFGAVSGSSPYTGSGTVLFEGEINPGNSPGAMSVAGDVALGSNSTLSIELGADNQDLLDVGGELQLDGLLLVTLLDDLVPQAGSSWIIAEADGGISGLFSAISLPQINGLVFALDHQGAALRLTASAVPLPAGVWLLMSALAVLVVRRRQAR